MEVTTATPSLTPLPASWYTGPPTAVMKVAASPPTPGGVNQFPEAQLYADGSSERTGNNCSNTPNSASYILKDTSPTVYCG